MQDHIRKILHIGARSWAAATVSAVQLLGVLGVLLLSTWLDVPGP